MKQLFTLGGLILLVVPTALETKSTMTEKDKKEIISFLKNVKKNTGIFTHKELLTRKISNKEMNWWKRAIVSTDLYSNRYGDETLNRSFDLVANTIRTFIETQQKLFDLFQKNAPFEEGMHLLQKLRLSLVAIRNNGGKLERARYVSSNRKELQKMIINLKEVIMDAANTLDQQYVSSSLNRTKKKEKSCSSLFPLECK